MSEELPKDYDLKEVCLAIGMSERWLRGQVSDGAEHLRYGHKIKFTAEQVEKLRASKTKSSSAESITTGRKRSR